ncbi:MAG TPA: hypothetical protein VM261_09780 [Kofleriaceae bacterium]|nr:hypothetical protein [Kofleriaceae bacterium]
MSDDLDGLDQLQRWQPPGPPAGFADRLDVAAMAAGGGAPGPRRARWPLVVGVAAALASAAAIAYVAWPSAHAPANVMVASRAFEARESVELGGRGVAVAEAGAAFGWRKDGDALTVRQESGDIFYRVDRSAGAPFVVTTPAGEIRVTGTCFRVEVIPMKPSKASVLGAAAGAAIATAAVVTVYEGKVLVASPSGKAEVKAGEKVTLDGAPPLPSLVAGRPVAIEIPAEPSANITREDLLVRDKAQREQIAALSTRLEDLEGAIAGGGGVLRRKGGPGHGEIEDWLNPSKDELLALAKECGVKLDIPPVMRGTGLRFGPEQAEAMGLTAEELAQVNQALADLKKSWELRVRGWYVEATGDSAGADQLSADSMAQEIQDKAGPDEPSALQKRISHERAGLLPTPTDLSRTSPYERYFRAFANLGEEAEQLLAAKIGPEKAHKVRAEEGGWPMRMSIAGCNDGEAEASADAPN